MPDPNHPNIAITLVSAPFVFAFMLSLYRRHWLIPGIVFAWIWHAFLELLVYQDGQSICAGIVVYPVIVLVVGTLGQAIGTYYGRN